MSPVIKCLNCYIKWYNWVHCTITDRQIVSHSNDFNQCSLSTSSPKYLLVKGRTSPLNNLLPKYQEIYCPSALWSLKLANIYLHYPIYPYAKLMFNKNNRTILIEFKLNILRYKNKSYSHQMSYYTFEKCFN